MVMKIAVLMVMYRKTCLYFFFLAVIFLGVCAKGQPRPDQIKFVRQAAQRFIFDPAHRIPLATLRPSDLVGMSAMHPISHSGAQKSTIEIKDERLVISATGETLTSIWFGGFNPFATYNLDLASLNGKGAVGFEFSDPSRGDRFRILVEFEQDKISDITQEILIAGALISKKSIATNLHPRLSPPNRIILQMLGSGLTLFLQQGGLPVPIGQSDFAQEIDLREKRIIHTFQSHFLAQFQGGAISVTEVQAGFSSGMGLADIRAITYEDGTPLLDQGRLWYTMTMRGRALPHHVQGVLSMDPTVFDLRLEGIIVFDRSDGILRNEVASHIFYDRKEKVWRGMTTGFSAYALPNEKKQLLAIESEKDPRFGFSIMKATPFGIVGDIEDPHIIYDEHAGKWRILTCENNDGYKAIMLESNYWNKEYVRIAGPVSYNSTGTSIQRIGKHLYCFSGSKDRKIYIYTYPDLREAGTLQMDLPPWDSESGTRVWPNVIELPEAYPFRYVALMMDRFNYPGLQGPNWSYGALYLYHGFVEN